MATDGPSADEEQRLPLLVRPDRAIRRLDRSS
jgi:hypothetical protein